MGVGKVGDVVYGVDLVGVEEWLDGVVLFGIVVGVFSGVGSVGVVMVSVVVVVVVVVCCVVIIGGVVGVVVLVVVCLLVFMVKWLGLL